MPNVQYRVDVAVKEFLIPLRTHVKISNILCVALVLITISLMHSAQLILQFCLFIHFFLPEMVRLKREKLIMHVMDEKLM